MIRVFTNEYCQKCLLFDPTYTSSVIGTTNKILHTVRCKDYKKCSAIEEMIREEIEKEQEENNAED